MMTTTRLFAFAISSAVALTTLLSHASAQSVPVYTQDYSYTPTYAPNYAQTYTQPQAPAQAFDQRLNAAQLDQLTGPVALYPDPLLAQVLPAATYPVDVVLAQRWLQANPNPTEDAINAQNWDPSIKALAHYPTVLQMLSDQLDWTQALGAAFATQQEDVMASVQRLRILAQAAGTLQTTQQQQVVATTEYVRILPAQPQVIYVPVYDPQVVYVRQPVYVERRPALAFSLGFSIGSWLDNDCNWRDHHVAVHSDWRRHDRDRNDHNDRWNQNDRDRNDHNDRWNQNDRSRNDNVRISNTPAVRTTINNSTQVTRTAPQAWKRNDAKPQPKIPDTVARKLGIDRDARSARPAANPTPAIAPRPAALAPRPTAPASAPKLAAPVPAAHRAAPAPGPAPRTNAPSRAFPTKVQPARAPQADPARQLQARSAKSADPTPAAPPAARDQKKTDAPRSEKESHGKHSNK